MNSLITRKESKRYPGLFVLKYKKKVFYDNLWNEDSTLLESRGHVEDSTGATVIRPFTKIFNRCENGIDIDRDETVIAVEKVNGFMACATWVSCVNDVVISTTGSLDSDFVGYAEDYLDSRVKDVVKFYHGFSFMFEIVHEKDPHIIPEKCGAYLIGMRSLHDEDAYYSSTQHELFLDKIAIEMNVMRPNWGVFTFSDVIDESKRCKHEGFVVYSLQSKKSLKIKSPYYLTLKLIARKADILSLNKAKAAEEYYDLIDHVQAIENFSNWSEQERLNYMREWLTK